MSDIKTNYPPERMNNAKKLILELESVPEDRREFVAMLGIAFLNGVESSEMLKQINVANVARV